MNPIEKITERKLKNSPVLLEQKNPDPEVLEYKKKLESYGIKNRTIKTIKQSEVEKKWEKEENAKKQAINILINDFRPFNIITYKTLDEVCKDHKLVIGSLEHYDLAIPDDNIMELDNFMEKLKTMDKSLLSKIEVKENKFFTFDSSRRANTPIFNERYPDRCATTDRMFKVAAPKKHFDFPKNYIRVGNEYGKLEERKPSFVLDLKVNTPNFELDPIIFMPVSFMNKVFCVVVTAWAEVADDSRILSKL